VRIREALLQDLDQVARRLWDEGFGAPPPPINLEAPTTPGVGDLTSNLALVWAQQTGHCPRELARTLQNRLPASPWFVEARSQGPGFLNFVVSPTCWREVVRDTLERGTECTSSRAGHDRPVEVPPSPNPITSPAEGRRALWLDARARLLQTTGFHVRRTGPPPGPAARLRLLGRLAHRLETFQDLLDRFGTPVVHFLMLERQGPPDFDLDLAADPSLRNPAQRVLHVGPRVEGLLKIAADQGCRPLRTPGIQDMEALGTAEDEGLIRMLEDLPWTVQRAGERGRPDLLTAWALALAARFHDYYDRQRILGTDTPILQARLALARAVRVALDAVGTLLGYRTSEST